MAELGTHKMCTGKKEQILSPVSKAGLWVSANIQTAFDAVKGGMRNASAARGAGDGDRHCCKSDSCEGSGEVTQGLVSQVWS